MQSQLIKYVSTKMPEINTKLVRDFSKECVEAIPDLLRETFQAAINTLVTCGITNFEYLGCELSSPLENVERLLRKKPYQKVFQVHETYSVEYVYSFRHDGVVYEMPIEIPFTVNSRIRLKGVDNYPMMVITDKGGISRMKDSLYVETLRVTMIYVRDKLSCLDTIEGKLTYASVIRTQQHYGKKGTRKDPPLLLYLFALKGFKETLDAFGVSDMLDIVEHVKHEEGVCHIAIGENAFIRMKGYENDNAVARIAFSIADILSTYSEYENVSELKTKRFYRVSLGAFTQAGIDDPGELDSHATAHLVMCNNSLDNPSKRLHASVGIVYCDFAELVEHMFTNIDNLLLQLKRHRTNVYEKRICGTQLLMNGVIARFHKDLYMVLNSKTDKTVVSRLNRLMVPRSFHSSLHATEMFDYVSTMYNDNIMSHLLRRKLVLHSSDLQSGKRRRFGSGGGNKIPVEFLRFHSSYPLTMGMFRYPSQKPISTGSLIPFDQIDDEGNFLKPDYWKHFCNLYGENPEKNL